MVETRYNQVKEIVKLRFMQVSSGVLVADNINLFIKPEPHKLSKIEEGRLRLISGVSMVDALVDKMLFGELFDTALLEVGNTHALVGWTPLLGGSKLLLNQFPDGVVSVDKTCWDWSVPEWMVELWLRFVLEMYDGYPLWYLTAIRVRFEMLFKKAVFQAYGRIVEQDFPGVMKSGCFLTILLNTLGQIILHRWICMRMGIKPHLCMPWSLGDDTVQNGSFCIHCYAEIMRTMGFNPKVMPKERYIEFVGYLMDSERVVPAYWKKHLFNLKYLDEEVAVETLDTYQMLYSDEPTMLRIVQDELRLRDPKKYKSANYLRMWKRYKA